MYKATVIIRRRPKILDPQGKAVEQGAKLLGFSNIQKTRIGKFIEFFVDSDNENSANSEVDEYCSKLLANEIIEDYEFTLEEVK